jgi:hypothetical protein
MINLDHPSVRKITDTYPKAIAHMWRQIQDGRFGLIFGAGISDDFKVPKWQGLIKKIAYDPEVKGQDIYKASTRSNSASSLAQILYQHFAASKVNKYKDSSTERQVVKREWRDIVRKQLYRSAEKDINKCLKRHSYIKYFLPIVRKATMTVNYNFDDFIERLLDAQEKEYISQDKMGEHPQIHGRNYEVIWNAGVQTRRPFGVIYHPNGYLPYNSAEPASNGLVFCEDEFADQLIESVSGRYASLLHFLSRNTCLFIGISLDDTTLKHLLRQNAQLNPGHFHYYISFKESGANDKCRDAITKANFDVYNLITLFLNKEEIASLGYLLNLPPDQAKELYDKYAMSYYYYVTGVPCAGKSSSVATLRSFVTYNEWLDDRNPDMNKRTGKLSPKQTGIIDKWVGNQFQEKNDQLIYATKDKKIGVHILDRAILDPLSFHPVEKLAERAQTLLEATCKKSDQYPIQRGMVILIKDDPDKLAKRCKISDKQFTKSDLTRMQSVLDTAYKGRHTKVIDKTKLSYVEAIRSIIWTIHYEDYKTIDFAGRLRQAQKGRIKWPAEA